MISMPDGNGAPGLWSVPINGSDPGLLVAGSDAGAWQWNPPVP